MYVNMIHVNKYAAITAAHRNRPTLAVGWRGQPLRWHRRATTPEFAVFYSNAFASIELPLNSEHLIPITALYRVELVLEGEWSNSEKNGMRSLEAFL